MFLVSVAMQASLYPVKKKKIQLRVLGVSDAGKWDEPAQSVQAS